MRESSNPYEAPQSLTPSGSLWSSICDFFRDLVTYSVPRQARRVFAQGGIEIQEGIAFYIDPSNTQVLFAASPSEDLSDSRMQLIAEESVRILPLFLEAHPQYRGLCTGRRLVVRIGKTYADLNKIIESEVEVYGVEI